MDQIRVLIVDDHSLVREGLKALLDNEDDVSVVADCEAVDTLPEALESARPDLLLVDIGMPTSPFDMVRRCVKENSKLRVLFVTAYDTELNLELAIDAGAHGIISKLADRSVMCEAVRKVASGGEFFSSDIAARIEILQQSDAGDGVTARHRLLSPREYEVLRLVAQGKSAKLIAKELHISVKTVDRHKSNIMTKLDLHNQVDLARYAIREGLIDP